STLPHQNPMSKTINHIRFFQALESSTRTQYRHMPNHRKKSPNGPTIPKMAHGNLCQKVILFVSTTPRNIGVRAITTSAERKKSIELRREISQLSLSQELGNHQIPTLCKRIALDRGQGYMNTR